MKIHKGCLLQRCLWQLLIFQGFCGFGSERKPLVNLRFFLGKTEGQGRDMFKPFVWEKLNRGGSKPGGFPLFFLGKIQTVSQTLSGLFLVGAVNRPRKRKMTNRENPRRVPREIGKVSKTTKKEGQVQIGKPPLLKPLRLAALD